MTVFDNNDNDRAAMFIFSSNHLYPNPNASKENKNMKNHWPNIVNLSIILIGLFIWLSTTAGQYKIELPSYEGGFFWCEWHDNESDWIKILESRKTGHIWMKNEHHGSWEVRDDNRNDHQLKYIESTLPHTCGHKANARPLWQRMFGTGTHNHFVSEQTLTLVGVQDPSFEQDQGFYSDNPTDLANHMESCDSDFGVIWED